MEKRLNLRVVSRSLRTTHKNTRISFGDYFADILHDPETQIGYWIIQRIGSADIVQWGQEESFAAAENCAKQYLEELMRKSHGMLEA
jgi:hypothetical protein